MDIVLMGVEDMDRKFRCDLSETLATCPQRVQGACKRAGEVVQAEAEQFIEAIS